MRGAAAGIQLPRRLRLAAASVAVWLMLLAPRASQACSQCLSGRSDETKLAYILTTVFLSALPLVVIGGGVWWLVRRVRAAERAVEARPSSLERRASQPG